MKVLESLGFENINYYISGREFRFPRKIDGNPTGTRIKVDTLNYQCYTTGEKGNLYTLVMNCMGYTYFPNALEYVVKVLELDREEFNQKIKYPFGGYYRELMKSITDPESDMKIYPESILTEYEGKFNTMFFRDGIDYQTQEKFGIGYDLYTNRITIPEYTLDGRLCGIMGRLNDENARQGDRWLPIIPCGRHLTLYGYHINYPHIQNKGLCIIGESEKFTQQLDSMGCNLGLSTCGCHISLIQEKHLKALLVPRLILAYDEGLDEEIVREEAGKLVVNNNIFHNKVGYIWDEYNEIIPKGSKGSPSDYGREAFTHLVKNCTKWI